MKKIAYILLALVLSFFGMMIVSLATGGTKWGIEFYAPILTGVIFSGLILIVFALVDLNDTFNNIQILLEEKQNQTDKPTQNTEE